MSDQIRLDHQIRSDHVRYLESVIICPNGFINNRKIEKKI